MPTIGVDEATDLTDSGNPVRSTGVSQILGEDLTGFENL
jgi:hypothetical protein